MRKFLDRLFELTGLLGGLFMIGTLLAVLSSIFGRFIPALELQGTDAYAGYCMAASAFLALASTLRRGEHIRVTLIINRLPDGAHRMMEIFCHVVALGVAGVLAAYSIRLVMRSYAFVDVSQGLDATPMWIPQVAMAIGTTMLAIAFAAELVDVISGKKLREDPKEGEPAHIE